MTTTHTPGPWRYTEESKGYAIEAGPLILAFVHGKLKGESNARLIAAAPALLEALTSFVQLEWKRLNRSIITNGDVAEVRKKADQALAQAEGRTP